MLDFREFKTEFIASCKNDIASLTDVFGCEDIEIEERSVTKAQRGDLSGLIFRAPDTVAAPTYYVEDFYGMYMDGVPIDKLSLDAAHSAFHYIYEIEFPYMNANEVFEDPGNLRVRLINRDRNKSLLETLPHIDTGCGLALISEVRFGEYRSVITRELAKNLMESMNMDETGLVRLALAMTASHETPMLTDLSEMLLHGQENCENLYFWKGSGVLSHPDSLYALSNSNFFWGASVLLFPGVIPRLTKLLGGDFYVLPSSVHEVLLLPAGMGKPDELREMIHEANCTVVEAEDFLSDDLIICEDGELRIVGGGDSGRGTGGCGYGESDYGCGADGFSAPGYASSDFSASGYASSGFGASGFGYSAGHSRLLN